MAAIFIVHPVPQPPPVHHRHNNPSLFPLPILSIPIPCRYHAPNTTPPLLPPPYFSCPPRMRYPRFQPHPQARRPAYIFTHRGHYPFMPPYQPPPRSCGGRSHPSSPPRTRAPHAATGADRVGGDTLKHEKKTGKAHDQQGKLKSILKNSPAVHNSSASVARKKRVSFSSDTATGSQQRGTERQWRYEKRHRTASPPPDQERQPLGDKRKMAWESKYSKVNEMKPGEARMRPESVKIVNKVPVGDAREVNVGRRQSESSTRGGGSKPGTRSATKR